VTFSKDIDMMLAKISNIQNSTTHLRSGIDA